MTAPPLFKLGQIGVGGHGGAHLAAIENLRCDGRVALSAVADPFGDRMPEVREQLAACGTVWYADYREMLKSESDLQGIVICTPIPLHEEMLRFCLDNSTARILLEKPAVPLIQQLDKAILHDRQRRVRVAFQSVHWPIFGSARVLLASQRIGRVLRITGAPDYLFGRPISRRRLLSSGRVGWRDDFAGPSRL